MSVTPRLELSYLAAAQAQKHVTLNEALRRLDGLVCARAVSRNLTAPPATPEDGECWLLTGTGTGAWEGHDDRLMQYVDGAWQAHLPFDGLRVWISDEHSLLVREDTSWLPACGEDVPIWGVNASPDETNRFAVASPASLFSHDGDDHRLTLNKAGMADTASLVFQTDWQGHAEMGLAGDNHFRIKLFDPDEAVWINALVMDGANRRVGFGCEPAVPFHVRGGEGAILQIEPSQQNGSTVSRKAGIDFYASFDGFPGDQGNRRTAFIVAGFDDGAWGKEYLSVCVGGSNDFSTVPTERMRVTGAGRVGIGVNAPTAQLHVDGGVRVGESALADLPAASQAGAGTIYFVPDGAAGACLAVSDGTGWIRLEMAGPLS